LPGEAIGYPSAVAFDSAEVKRMSKDLSLDQEGIPDLDGPLPEKVQTGDPQEGISPPADHPASLDWGTTAAEQREQEPLSTKLARQQPDTLVAASDLNASVELIEAGDSDGDGELVAHAVEANEAAIGAEQAAIHLISDTESL